MYVFASTRDISQYPSVYKNEPIFRYSALGACTEVSAFFFKLLEPKLFEEYRKVVGALDPRSPVRTETRPKSEVFTARTLLVNLMTNEQKGSSDWIGGLVASIPVGDFQGGDMLFRELGLQVKSGPGSLHLFRGHELRYSTTKWTGRRFCVVQTTHEAIKRWAGRHTNAGYIEDEYEMDDSIDVKPEGIHPDDYRYQTDRERIGWAGVDTSDDERIEREMYGIDNELPREVGEKKRKAENDGDDSASTSQEGYEDKGKEKKRKEVKTS